MFQGINLKELTEKIQMLREMPLPLDKKPIYNCETCQDSGWIIRKVEGLESALRCDCFESTRVDRVIKSSKITVDFRKQTFDSWDTEDLPEIVRNAHACALNYASCFERVKTLRQNSIALLGQSGSGKTHLLCAVANTLLDKRISVLYFPFVEGFNEIKDNFDILEQRINKMQKAEVLFIDDLFKGRKEPTQFQIEQMFAVINYRYLNNLPLLVSSEKNISDLILIDEALGSRLYEMCKDFIVEIKGKNINYRLRDANAE